MSDLLFIKLENEARWLKPLALEQSLDLEAEATDDFVSKGRLSWILHNRSSDSALESGTLADLVAYVKAERGDFFDLKSVLLISGTYLVSTLVNIPSKQSKHIMQALPFMLEDQLAEDVEKFHLVAGAKTKAGDVPVILSKKSQLEALTERFKLGDVPLDMVIPDMYCLPVKESEWRFLTEGRHLLIRLSEHEAFSIELDDLPVVMASLLHNAEPKPGIIRVDLVTDHMNGSLENWLKTQITSYVADQDIEVVIEHIASTRFVALTDYIHSTVEKSPHNVLTGDFKPVPLHKPTTIKWKPVAIMGTLLLVLNVGFQHAKSMRLETRSDAIQAQNLAMYKRYFPKSKKTSNLKRTMESYIKSSGQQSEQLGFFPLLTQVGEKLNELNRSGDKLVPTRISFDEKQGDLKLDLTAGGFSDIDVLKSKLQTIPLTVEVASASNDGDKVKARINVRSSS